jgi:hypothetical protein
MKLVSLGQFDMFPGGTTMEKTFRTTANSLRSVLLLAAVLGMGGGVAFAQQPPDGPPCPTSTLGALRLGAR